MSLGADVLTFLARLAPEAARTLPRLLSAILAGDVARAEREARAAAQAQGLRELGRATVAARRKLR